MTILSLNVCGLVSKLKYPEFVSYIKQYDIITLQETKTDESDDVCFPGYTVYTFHRKKLARYRSGGVALLIRNSILPFINVETDSTCKLVHFFTISKQLYGNHTAVSEDLKCGIVYIPPNGTKYSYEDPYFEIQNEIFRYCSNSTHLLLLGDFNSRCGNLLDYIHLDNILCDIHDLNAVQSEEQCILKQFENNHIPLYRNSVDTVVTSYGKQFIDLCRNNNMFILNGRIGNDFNNPQLTCKYSSTVDYIISSAPVFDSLVDFCVDDFCHLYSDVHKPLSITLKTKLNREIPSNVTSDASPKIKLWDISKAQEFINNLDLNKIADIDIKLDKMISNSTSTKVCLEDIISDIGTLFETNAKNTFVKTNFTTNTKDSSFKRPWFNYSCERMRNIYHKTRKTYNKYKTEYYKTLLKQVSKEYKSTVRKTYNKYNNDRVIRLRHLQNAKPRDFWRILNSNKTKSSVDAPLNDLYLYFKTLNESPNDIDETNMQNADNNNDDLNEEINSPITENEILSAVNRLKNNKASGIDNIVNEHIKSTINIMLPIYHKLFNFIFDKGIVPDSWTIGLIKPIYKNKGDPKLPENYRPISLLSCFGKLFTSILNARLNTYTEETNLIHETQAGFRSNYSTIDNIFILKSLIDIVHADKNKLFCCFIDFKQAFDSVSRTGLWKKLKRERINGKCFDVIHNMYKNVKSKIVTADGASEYFECLKGVRQGENLSPLLFNIFLNDLEDYLGQSGIDGVCKQIETNNIQTFLKLFILLYADDTVIFSNNETDLQNALDNFDTYCKMWKLKVNISKTKVLVFSKGNPSQKTTFKLGENILEFVNEYKYLGIYFTKSGSFVKTKQYIADQANKAMFSLLKKIKSLTLPYDIQLELFEKTIKPILLYGCEIWGFGNLDIIERVQLKFFKYIFKFKKSTPSYMVYGELGITPISVDVQNRIISYWSRLIDNVNNNTTIKLSSKLYILLHEIHSISPSKYKWIDKVKQILCLSGYSGVWYNQYFINKKWFVKSTYKKKRHFYSKLVQ